MQVLSMLYLWLKAGHVIFVIFWMAGLFMLPRYFVYHQEDAMKDGRLSGPMHAKWSDRERKLLKIILWPALTVVWVLGFALALTIGALQQPWFHAKLALVLVLTAYHIWLAGYAKTLWTGQVRLTGRRLRMLNEVPGVTAALIVILVILKPFG